jgi:shikimate dehydrogenase
MKRFGIIGKKLSHSFSEDYFNKKFEKEGFGDCSYEMFELNEPNEISKLVETNNDLIGVNVTIPFKTNIIPFLDALDPVAKQVGAVNTITVNRIGDRVKLVGYNTDIYGFELSTNAFETYKNAVILGTGGAAKAVSHVLKKKTIRITDRLEAIKTAIMISLKDDIILIAGKGHETYQEVNGVKSHFDDREIAVEYLNNLNSDN